MIEQLLGAGPSLLAPALFVLALVVLVVRTAWPARRSPKVRAALRAAWAVAEPARRRDRDVILALHRARPPGPGELALDDDAAADLDLDQVFTFLDRTLTEAGQQALALMLRRPQSDLARLASRAQALAVLGGNAEAREELQLALEPLGGAAPGTLVPLLARAELPRLPGPPRFYDLCALAALAAIPSAYFLGPAGWLLLLAAFLLNGILHYSAEQRVTAALPGIFALQELLGAAERLSRATLPGLEAWQEILRGYERTLAPISRALRGVQPPRSDDAAASIALYFDIFSLRRVRLFARASPLVSVVREPLLALLQAVGTLDALQSIASVRAGRKDHCVPSLDAAAPGLHAENLHHPLLANAIANPLDLDGCALITGSNMSGKSTWLRAVGLNALFAQTICTCFADKWSGPPVRLTTSLRHADSLADGRSYYLAEAEGIRAALRTLGASPRPLCVLDEIFRGTNSVERVAAATAVLRHLERGGALVLAATHDHVLTALLDGCYQNFHFSERIGKGGLDFDYVMKPGPASTRNAIDLLRFLGYPDAVVAEAESIRDAPPSGSPARLEDT